MVSLVKCVFLFINLFHILSCSRLWRALTDKHEKPFCGKHSFSLSHTHTHTHTHTHADTAPHPTHTHTHAETDTHTHTHTHIHTQRQTDTHTCINSFTTDEYELIIEKMNKT